MTGWLQPAEGSGTPDRRPHDNLLPQLRIADALQHVSQDLYGGYVIADQVTPPPSNRGGTLARVTPASLPRPDSFTSLRNLLYALEWWVFAGFAVFLWWRWCSDELADPEEDPQVHEPGPEGEPDHAPEDPMQPRPGVASKT
jgi:hypothetical protein